MEAEKVDKMGGRLVSFEVAVMVFLMAVPWVVKSEVVSVELKDEMLGPSEAVELVMT